MQNGVWWGLSEGENQREDSAPAFAVVYSSSEALSTCRMIDRTQFRPHELIRAEKTTN